VSGEKEGKSKQQGFTFTFWSYLLLHHSSWMRGGEYWIVKKEGNCRGKAQIRGLFEYILRMKFVKSFKVKLWKLGYLH
jgi:hypothetical protein